MTDRDVVRVLADDRRGIEYDVFRAMISTWPDWMRVDEHDIVAGPESGTVYHTHHHGRRFAIVTPRDLSGENDLRCDPYGITDGVLRFSWGQLVNETAPSVADLPALIRRWRNKLPDLLAECDWTRMGEDGGIDTWDRRYEGSQLIWTSYYRWNESWDHDHRVSCFATFALN